MVIDVMTFNIHHGVGVDHRFDLKRIADVITSVNPDIVGLNEVDRFMPRSGGVDEAALLGEMTGLIPLFGPSIERDAKEMYYGNALLSRYPIIYSANHTFSFPFGIENRSMLEERIRVGDTHIRVFVTHLSLDPFTHFRQTGMLLQKILPTDEPTLIMGDWNMFPHGPRYRRIRRHLIDAWNKKDEAGNTYPSIAPKRRLDYLFCSKHFHILDAQVVTTDPQASDHLPLAVRLALGST